MAENAAIAVRDRSMTRERGVLTNAILVIGRQ